MPYLDHQMATSISDYMSKSKNVSSSSSSSSSSLNQQETMRSAKLIRTMASCTKASSKNLSTSRKEQLDEQLSTSKYKIEIDLRKLLYLRNLLKAEIEILLRPKRIPRSQNCPNYKDYLVDYDKQLFDDGRSKYYHSINQKYPTKQLCCRIIEPSASSPELSKLLESNNLYWRILKHLGKKHQYIVQTWDLFLNDKNSLEIHQEYCPLGDLDRFVRSNSLSEQQIALYAWQLLKGLDFLGDIGISHRNIQPKNLFLVPGEPENCLKITNLENAIIYWNIENNDIVFQSCLPISQQLVDGENFQAPEIYGDPNEEEFDPIKADTWSYGAVLYFMSNKTYPFKISSESIDLEQEIQSNIDKLSLSELGKELLRALLKTDSNERMPIGFIEKSDWFDQAKKCRIRMKEPQTLAKENRPNRAEKANKFFQSKVFGRPTDDADESEGGGVKMEKIEKQSLPMTVSKAKPKSKSKKKKSVSKSSSSISASKSKLRKKSRSRSTKKSTSISKESLSTATAASATSIADGDGSTDAVSSKKDLTVSKLKGETRRGALNSFSDSLSSSKSTSIQTSDVLKRDLAEDEQKTIALNQSITKDLVGLNEDEKKKNEISSKSINVNNASVTKSKSIDVGGVTSNKVISKKDFSESINAPSSKQSESRNKSNKFSKDSDGNEQQQSSVFIPDVSENSIKNNLDISVFGSKGESSKNEESKDFCGSLSITNDLKQQQRSKKDEQKSIAKSPQQNLVVSDNKTRTKKIGTKSIDETTTAVVVDEERGEDGQQQQKSIFGSRAQSRKDNDDGNDGQVSSSSSKSINKTDESQKKDENRSVSKSKMLSKAVESKKNNNNNNNDDDDNNDQNRSTTIKSEATNLISKNSRSKNNDDDDAEEELKSKTESKKADEQQELESKSRKDDQRMDRSLSRTSTKTSSKDDLKK